MSADALKSCREQIQTRFGAPYVPEQPNVYKSAKGAQDAHEAVRPTDLSYTPERVAPFLPTTIAEFTTGKSTINLDYARNVAFVNQRVLGTEVLVRNP